MRHPHKAFILAAGLGTRMWPLSAATPKPMMPLWGRPLIDRTLGLLRRWGVDEVLINLHHAPSPLVVHLRRNPPRDLRLSFSFEPEILGTGGAVAHAAWFLDTPCFWMINADIVADVDPVPLLRAWCRSHALAALWLTDAAGPRTVEMESDSRIRTFRSARAGQAGTYTFCGLQLLSPRILRFIPAGFSTIVSAYEAAARQGESVVGICVPNAAWADTGTPRDYIAAHALTRDRRRCAGSPYRPQQTGAAALRRAGIRLSGVVAVGRNVRVGRGSHLTNTVLWDGAILAPGTRATDLIAAGGVCLRGRVQGLAGPADSTADPVLIDVVRRLGWLPERTTVIPLAPRGSARAFSRLLCGRRSAILVRYTLERPENALYTQNARLLSRIGVRVPAVLLDAPAQGLSVIEDLGDTSLLDVIPGARESVVLCRYQSVLGLTWRLHRRGTQALKTTRLSLCEPFGEAVYRYERELFAHHYLARLPWVTPALQRDVMRELAQVARHLMREAPCLVHRDLQSTNVLLRHGQPALIDFQGMRLGPAVYDLASLLCDPYVALPESIQDTLLRSYAALARRPPADLTAAFRWASVERLTQALGAYGRLSANPLTRDFARHIPPALRQLARALAHVDNLPRLNETVKNLDQTLEK